MPVSIEDFADIINVQLEILFRTNWGQGKGRWYCKFQSSDVVDDIFLLGVYGNGETPNESVRAYAKEIAGKRIKISHYKGDKYFNVPKDLE